jgi:integral membrane protein
MTEPTGQPTATPTPAPATPRPAGSRPAVDVRARLTRYRVMAFVTGTMLLVLCLEMLLKYVFQANGVDAAGSPRPVLGTWIAIVHGWIYVVYLVTVVQLWSAMRWSLGRLVTMALAGVVPVMSFILERRVHAEALARIDGAR